MVCLTCDELLIDIEIECDEDPVVIRKDPTTSLYRSEAKTKESSN